MRILTASCLAERIMATKLLNQWIEKLVFPENFHFYAKMELMSPLKSIQKCDLGR
jgi:hypothetical protein